MKNLLKIVAVFMLLLGSAQVQAQSNRPAQRTPPTPEVRAERRAMSMKEKLMLTDEQKAKVYDAVLVLEKQRGADQQKMKANRDQFESELHNILTPEQMEKYEAMREERKAEVKKRMEERRNQDKMKQENNDPAEQK